MQVFHKNMLPEYLHQASIKVMEEKWLPDAQVCLQKYFEDSKPLVSTVTNSIYPPVYLLVYRHISSTVLERFLPSPGSIISTVDAAGNSRIPMTGSERTIWKDSECSCSPSLKIRTRHVAKVWPGLNCTCFWAFPLKSLSFLAVPSLVLIPVKTRNSGHYKHH